MTNVFAPHNVCGIQGGQKLLQRVWWLAAVKLSFILLLCVNAAAGESPQLVLWRLKVPKGKSMVIYKEVCFAALPTWPRVQELKLFTPKDMSFSFLCMRQRCPPPPLSLKERLSSGSSWDGTRKTLPSFPIYFSHDPTSYHKERIEFLWSPFSVWFLCWKC